MAGFIHKTTCRVCGGSDLVNVLDLGAMPPANAYVRQEDLQKPEESFPLELFFCRTCSLVQLLDVVDPEILFKDYHYLTSASVPLVAHFKRYAEEAILPLITSPSDLVVDIGGNDGTLLSFLHGRARVLNVEPAENLTVISEEKGVAVYPAFFTSRAAEDIVALHGNAQVVTANNVYAHIDDLRDVTKGVAALIGEDGVFIFEVHWVKHLIEEGSFDQIYHEHLCFHSLHALQILLASEGLTAYDVEIVPIQGESLRVYAAKNRAQKSNVARVLALEKAAGLTDEKTYQKFAEKVQTSKQEVLALLRDLKMQGKIIAGYGAPAKGNTLLNYYGLGPDIISYITDTTPQKQGLFTPAMHIPIVPPEQLRADPPDYIVLLAWNYADAILEKEKELRARGVKFIVTVPTVTIM